MLWKISLYEMSRSFFAFAVVVDGDDIDVDDDDVDDGDRRHVLLHLFFKIVSKNTIHAVADIAADIGGVDLHVVVGGPQNVIIIHDGTSDTGSSQERAELLEEELPLFGDFLL